MINQADNIENKYKKFQNDYGSGVNQDYDFLINSLFTENFTKVINGKVFVSERAKLRIHLSELYKTVGGWKSEEIRTIKSAHDNDYVMRYKVHTRNGEIFDFITILVSKDGIKIDSVDEICYKVQ